MAQPFISKKFGAVAVLDALGTKGRWKQESATKIINKWEELITAYKKAIKKPSKKGYKMSIHAFSDTVIITFTDTSPYELMLAASEEVTSFVLFALGRRVFFRGCLSVGNVYTGSQIVIGPAIDEAAQYYEMVNWIGVTFSPSANKIIKKPSFQKFAKSRNYDNYFVKHDIPMKSRVQKNGFALNIKRDYELLKFVYMLRLRTFLPKKPETLLGREMKKASNRSAMKKWKNTMKFFEKNQSVHLDNFLKKR